MVEVKKRLGVGLGGLTLVLLGLLASMALAPQPAGARSTLPQPRPSFVLWNEGPGDVEVQVNQVAEYGRMGRVVKHARVLPAQDIGRTEGVTLSGPCQQQLWVQVHGRDFMVSGNFCPESYSEEQKTLVVFGSQDRRPEVVGEDVE